MVASAGSQAVSAITAQRTILLGAGPKGVAERRGGREGHGYLAHLYGAAAGPGAGSHGMDDIGGEGILRRSHCLRDSILDRSALAHALGRSRHLCAAACPCRKPNPNMIERPNLPAKFRAWILQERRQAREAAKALARVCEDGNAHMLY